MIEHFLYYTKCLCESQSPLPDKNPVRFIICRFFCCSQTCGQNVEQAVYGLFSARIQEKSRCLGITERKRPGQKAAVTDFFGRYDQFDSKSDIMHIWFVDHIEEQIIKHTYRENNGKE